MTAVSGPFRSQVVGARAHARALVFVASCMVSSAVSLSGCELALNVDGKQCTESSDCVELLGRGYTCSSDHVCIDSKANGKADSGTGDKDGGGELPAEWACIKGPPQTVVPQAGRTVSIRFAVTDFTDLRAPKGLTGKVCNATDVPCERPIEDKVVPDNDGYLAFDVPHAFQGFAVFSAPGYEDTLAFNNRPYSGGETQETSALLTRSSVEQISEGGGEQLDETKGIALISIYDCDGNAATGVRVMQLDNSTTEHPFYFEGTLPDRDRDTTVRSTQLTATMVPLALAGFSRVDPGYVTVVGILASTGDEIGRVTLQVRPLTISVAELHAGF